MTISKEISNTVYVEIEIKTQAGDPEVKSLHDDKLEGLLNLTPDFQREYVWDRKRASRLVESVILGVPLPTIYIAEDDGGVQTVIDGQQRLTSLFNFIDGLWDGKPGFKLSGLEERRDLNRKSFSELDPHTRKKIIRYKLRVVTILKENDPELRFRIFERLNSGSMALKDMELRNCVYRGPYIDLLKSLAEEKDFKRLIGKFAGHRRMLDVELVLRFAAFLHKGYQKFQSPMKSFFNADVKQFREIGSEEADELREQFRKAVWVVKSLFGPDYFFTRYLPGNGQETDGHWEAKAFNASLYDVLMGSFHQYQKPQLQPHLDSLREGLISLMADDTEFADSIQRSTSSRQMVLTRFKKVSDLVDLIVGLPKKEPRCFSFSLKREMYEANPTCEICHQKIADIDDAAIDHIEQYWTGGKTIPENARLAHRYCNNARSRMEKLKKSVPGA